MSVEKQMQDAVLVYVANQIKKQSDYPDKWVCWNGAVVKILDSLEAVPSGYLCQGTVSEALYHIEEDTLLYFLTATC